MKIAILSDIHGVVPALEVILAHIDGWKPDITIVNGDVVNRGPKPLEAWQLIEDRIENHGWLMTKGNHEEYTIGWKNQREEDMSSAEFELYRSSLWTYNQLNPTIIEKLSKLPNRLEVEAPDGSKLEAMHASRQGNTHGIMPRMSVDEIRERIAPNPEDVFVTSHTHRLFQRQIDQTLLVNSGSVGVPLDGDVRTGYAQITWNQAWTCDLVRLDYDRDRTWQDFVDTDFVKNCGPSARLMALEWQQATSHIPFWGRAYRNHIQTGEMTPDESIDAYLATL